MIGELAALQEVMTCLRNVAGAEDREEETLFVALHEHEAAVIDLGLALVQAQMVSLMPAAVRLRARLRELADTQGL